ncbi:3-hydroxyacyl-CoA dehydrogenase family protein [Shewanella litorisediminis]|uniref:3-hydroxybutyryl-CoA dehydrogenase n=1 Tax=Shewanella litorisediminis TaxID=1173586 RepID=A0ABX7G011_9GAMM|nr:3-hydroxyacyl-CoA dehydrogenase NAD-binding domain-containing protein [Shewanella litorisediminis]MCL2918347.1 3-hydroxyacyl-CoA dehydrogenase NAD-binding domain-containing protein [Shewanella litorisediminis]QRH00606.1 3-hydroxybutyryl-CoA dehydrogenase [Shewanella litorisediminis]
MLVCILGSGTMGSGIASLFCICPEVSRVIIWGRSQAALDNSYIRIKKELSRYAKGNAISAEALESMCGKISFKTDLSELTNSDLYIEAISEDLDIKIDLISRLKVYIPDKAIVATNTSSLSVTALAMQVNVPSNFIGIHFFNPTSVMKLVEVIKGLVTSDETLRKAISLVEMLDKKPIVVKESAGFIVNRMLIPMINEAIAILAEGVASKQDIDNAMKYGANHPIGPLALSDLIGNDVCLSIMESLFKETGDPKYRAHPLLRQYVRAGYLGRKTKVGFYEYQ